MKILVSGGILPLILIISMASPARAAPGKALPDKKERASKLRSAVDEATKDLPDDEKSQAREKMSKQVRKFADYIGEIKNLKGPDAEKIIEQKQERLRQELKDDYETVAKIAKEIYKIDRKLLSHGGGSPDAGDLGAREHVMKINLDMNRNDPEARADYGTVLYYERRYREAFDNLGEAIKGKKADPVILTLYGRSAYELGDYQLAAQSGQAALGMDPSSQAANALYKLSVDRVPKINLPSALADAGLQAPAEEAQPSNQAASWAPAQPAQSMSAAEIAAAASRQAQAPPSNLQQSAALTREVASDLSVKDYGAAYWVATKAIELNPRNAQAWNYRAIADNKTGRYGDAVYDSSFALGLAPGNAAALQSRSWAFSKQKKFKEGLADANSTIEKEPDNSFAYQNRAFALAGLGDREGALQALKRSAELDARFAVKYRQAVQAPQNSDLLFLFNEEPAARAAAASPAPAPSGQKRRFLRLVVLSLSGGLLMALGILHIVSASWREKVRTTMRRVLSPSAVQARPAAVSGGFWSQYELIKGIGSGGMGIVYEARDKSLDRRVAVKKMRDEIRMDPTERRRFVTEARTVAALHHPNIVDIYSIVEEEQDVYLVFEYVSGHTLSDLLRDKGPLPYDEALKVLREACEAVEYAHRQKVIHRDVKPSNIMIAEDARVKVMDFGVARQAKDALTKMSMTNTIVGTPPYMAPEQEQGTVRKESDVFALGVCFYEMLCGRLPFAGQGAGMLLNKINGRHAPISKQPTKGVPQGLDEVMAKALFPDPEKRYHTPSEFMAAVDALSAAPHG